MGLIRPPSHTSNREKPATGKGRRSCCERRRWGWMVWAEASFIGQAYAQISFPCRSYGPQWRTADAAACWRACTRLGLAARGVPGWHCAVAEPSGRPALIKAADSWRAAGMEAPTGDSAQGSADRSLAGPAREPPRRPARWFTESADCEWREAAGARLSLIRINWLTIFRYHYKLLCGLIKVMVETAVHVVS